jgi:membrane protein YqaA with SNARE-associated domain
VTGGVGGFIGKWLLRYKTFVFGVLAPLGFWGLGLISAIDSGAIPTPVPMDVIISTYVWNDKRHAFLYVLMAAIGSAVGGLLPFLLGRAGGELFLLRRIDRARYEAMMARFEKQEFLAMAIPSALPPPTPWKAFAFGAGVFEMRIGNFMLAVFVGRMVRFGVEAILTVKYGPEIVKVAGQLFTHHMVATVSVLGVLLCILLVWMLRHWFRRSGEGGATAANADESEPRRRRLPWQ